MSTKIDLASRIAAAYMPGVKASHVSREMGAHYALTREAFRELGWPLVRGTPASQRMSAANEAIAECVRNNPAISITVVAARFGVTKQRVSQILKRAKITKVHAQTALADARRAKRQAAKRHEERKRQAARSAVIAHAGALRARGWKLKQIAGEMGVSLMTAYRWCKEHEKRTGAQPRVARVQGDRHV